MGRTFKVTKIDAAVDQLDWAIRLFLDHGAYVSAITLAHAAEVIIGDNLRASNAQPAHAQLASSLSEEIGVSPKDVIDFMNEPANWLKHWGDKVDSQEMDLELETIAIGYIIRAAINLHEHDQTLVSEFPRFRKWIKTHRPDIDPMRDQFKTVIGEASS